MAKAPAAPKFPKTAQAKPPSSTKKMTRFSSPKPLGGKFNPFAK
jgi:hypothetical protein